MRQQFYQAVHRQACNFKALSYTGKAPEDMCARLNKDVEGPVVRLGFIPTRFRLLMETSDKGIMTLALGLSHAQYDGFCLPTLLDALRSSQLGRV